MLAVPPAPVRSAVDAHRRAFDRDGIAYLHREEVRAEQAVLAAAAEYLETDPELIALTDSTSMGLGLIYGGALLAPGDELLTTAHDFYATHEAMRFAALRTGATVRKVQLYGDSALASADEMVERLVGSVSDATRMIGITWVHSGTGVKLPVRAIADRLAEINERRPDARRVLLVARRRARVRRRGDAGLATRLRPLRIGLPQVALRPAGTGIVWGRPEAWATLAPVIPSFAPTRTCAWMLGRPADLGDSAWGATMTPGGYHSFEQRWALAPAFEFHTSLGRERVQQRILELTEQLKSGLREIDGVRVRTPADPEISAGIVCFKLDSADPDEAVSRLRERGVRVSVAPYATRNLRAGATLAVDEAGIERALAEIGRLARA